MKKFWKPIAVVLIFCIMQVVASMCMLPFIDKTSEEGIAQHPTLFAWILIISGLLTVAALLVMRMIKSKTFRVTDIKWKHAPLALVGAIMGIIATDLLSEQLALPNLMKMEFLELAKNFWGILAICIVGPIVEELVFRESIIHYLLKHRTHRWAAILFSAVAFGLIHLNPAQVPFAVIMGIILGIIYVKTGNIVLTSIIHIFNNTLAVIEMNLLGDKAEEITYADLLGGTAVCWVYIVVCTIMCVLFMRQFWKQYHRKHLHERKDND